MFRYVQLQYIPCLVLNTKSNRHCTKLQHNSVCGQVYNERRQHGSFTCMLQNLLYSCCINFHITFQSPLSMNCKSFKYNSNVTYWPSHTDNNRYKLQCGRTQLLFCTSSLHMSMFQLTVLDVFCYFEQFQPLSIQRFLVLYNCVFESIFV